MMRQSLQSWWKSSPVFSRIRWHFTTLRLEHPDYSRDVVWVSRWNDVNAWPITRTELAHRGFIQVGGYMKVLR